MFICRSVLFFPYIYFNILQRKNVWCLHIWSDCLHLYQKQKKCLFARLLIHAQQKKRSTTFSSSSSSLCISLHHNMPSVPDQISFSCSSSLSSLSFFSSSVFNVCYHHVKKSKNVSSLCLWPEVSSISCSSTSPALREKTDKQQRDEEKRRVVLVRRKRV